MLQKSFRVSGLLKSSLVVRATPNRTSCFRDTRFARSIHVDGRNRVTGLWAPSGGRTSKAEEDDKAGSLLVNAGFLRQAHSGVFHMLPLGLRVQDKLEKLIDKHMGSIGASKLSLSSISTAELWQRTGRFEKGGELLHVKDRKESGFLLCPTHEEEITALVADNVHSYKDLPLRLYQIGRKYRDEKRPRQGLLRAKEFLMKDLYTFDYSEEMALETYESVRRAYSALFDELKLPYVVANADSGNMGGNLSHEYHFLSPKGEDNVIICNSCEYVANEELAEKGKPTRSVEKISVSAANAGRLLSWIGINHSRDTLYRVWIPKPAHHTGEPAGALNFSALKRYFPDIDFSIESLNNVDTLLKTHPVKDIYDYRVSPGDLSNPNPPSPVGIENYDPTTSTELDFTSIQASDPCPKCDSGKLSIQRAIEIGHTFHLGTRYSKPLEAYVQLPTELENGTKSKSPSKKAKDVELSSAKTVPMQMGCHGIGVSRLLAAAAGLIADERGLNWPVAIAPYHVVVVTGRGVEEADAVKLYDMLSAVEIPTIGANARTGAKLDVLLDDRTDKDLGWKLKDADLVGYPVIVVLGRAWKQGMVEVQCRRVSGFKRNVPVDTVAELVTSLLGEAGDPGQIG